MKKKFKVAYVIHDGCEWESYYRAEIIEADSKEEAIIKIENSVCFPDTCHIEHIEEIEEVAYDK